MRHREGLTFAGWYLRALPVAPIGKETGPTRFHRAGGWFFTSFYRMSDAGGADFPVLNQGIRAMIQIGTSRATDDMAAESPRGNPW